MRKIIRLLRGSSISVASIMKRRSTELTRRNIVSAGRQINVYNVRQGQTLNLLKAETVVREFYPFFEATFKLHVYFCIIFVHF